MLRLSRCCIFLQLASYPRCTLRGDYGRLLDSKQFCDMVFLVGEVSEMFRFLKINSILCYSLPFPSLPFYSILSSPLLFSCNELGGAKVENILASFATVYFVFINCFLPLYFFQSFVNTTMSLFNCRTKLDSRLTRPLLRPGRLG